MGPRLDLQSCDPSRTFSLYKLITSSICDSDRKLSNTQGVDNWIFQILFLLLTLFWGPTNTQRPCLSFCMWFIY